MATKSDMIDFILQNSDQKKEDLEDMTYKQVKEIFNETDEKEEEVVVDYGFTKEIPMTPSIIDGDAVVDPLPKVEEKEEKVATAPDFFESAEVNKKIADKGIDIKSLSPVQKRAYARSGRIPKKK